MPPPISTGTPPARASSDRRADTRPRVSSSLSSRPVVASPRGLSPSPQKRHMALDQHIAANVQRPSRPPSRSSATRPQPEPVITRAGTPPSSNAADRPRGNVPQLQYSRQTRRIQPTGPISGFTSNPRQCIALQFCPPRSAVSRRRAFSQNSRDTWQ